MNVVSVESFCYAPSAETQAIQAEIETVISAIPFIIWPGYSEKKAKKHQVGNIAGLNAFFAAKFRQLGWLTDYRRGHGDIPDAFKCFGDYRVAVEVQFANHARDADDVLKFLRLFDHKKKGANLFIRIALDDATIAQCSSGLATAKNFAQRVRGLGHRYDAPTLSFSISSRGAEVLDISGCGVKPEDLLHKSKAAILTELAEVRSPPRPGAPTVTLHKAQLDLFPLEQ